MEAWLPWILLALLFWINFLMELDICWKQWKQIDHASAWLHLHGLHIETNLSQH